MYFVGGNDITRRNLSDGSGHRFIAVLPDPTNNGFIMDGFTFSWVVGAGPTTLLVQALDGD